MIVSIAKAEKLATQKFLLSTKLLNMVANRIDNAKYKAKFNKKAKMLAFEEVETIIGHAVGGVCPFAINDGIKVYLDESLKRFETVYPACGSSNSSIELTIEELEKYSNYISLVDVCKIYKNK